MHEYNYKLVKVVDGDTIDVDIDLGFGIWLKKQRIRMMGIDTPESRTSDKEEKVYGILAKEKLIALLSQSRSLRTFKDAKGKYGRILADVIVYDGVEDRWFGATQIMIRDSYGVKYHGQNKEDIQEAHLANREILNAQGIVN
jgi:micrococcal nuclease